MYHNRVGTLRLDQQDQKEANGNVLSEVRVNPHGTQHRFIARIANAIRSVRRKRSVRTLRATKRSAKSAA